MKMGKEEMLWQKRLKEKQGREKNDDNSNSGTNTNDNNNYRSKKRRSIKRGEENAALPWMQRLSANRGNSRCEEVKSFSTAIRRLAIPRQ